MTLVLRDKYGNVVEPMKEGASPKVEKQQPARTYEQPAVEEHLEQEPLGIGQGALAGLEEVNTMNPFSGLVRLIAAGLVAPFSDKTYGEIYDEMGRRQEARKNIGRATEGELFKNVREPVQKVGEALIPIEDIMMGQALLGWASKLKKVEPALKAISSNPTVQRVAGVLSKTVGSRNPLVRAGSLAGLTGTGTAAYDIAKGENAATTIADSLSNAASIGLPVLGAGYLPAGAFYPAMALSGAGKGYVTRRGQNKETNFSDILGDVAAAIAYGKLLRGEIIPEDTAIEKGSKAAKAVDKYKKPYKEATGNIEDDVVLQNYDKDTPFWKVPLKKSKDFFEHFRKIDQTKASDFARDVIRPMQQETGAKLKTRLDKEFPKVKATTDLQKEYAGPYKKAATSFDKAAVANPNKRPIKVERVNKVFPEGSTERHIQDDLYRDVRGPRGDNGEYNRYYYQKAREKASELGTNDSTMEKVAEKMRQVQAYQKAHKKAWKSADTKSHKLQLTEKAIGQSGTPENAAYKAKNTMWENENYLSEPADKVTYDKLKTIDLPNNPPLSKESSKLAMEYDHLVDAQKILNAKVADAKDLTAQIGAAAPAGRLAKYSVGTKVGERALQYLGRLRTREAAETLSKMTVGDVEKLLRAKWGSSVPFVETISAVKNLPKRKEKRK